MAPKVIIIAGPPCAGKGTQCQRIAKERGLLHISTGDVFRSEVAKGSELGMMCKPFLEAGSFVPDELVINYIAGRLSEPAAQHGVLLDGFPRTAEQALALTARIPIYATIVIEIDDESLTRRATGRRIDSLTGAIYHLIHEPPPPDIPPERLIRRELDNPASFKVRLDTQRAALRRALQGLPVKSVNGLQSLDDVTAAILRILDQEPPEHVAGVSSPPVDGPQLTCAVCLAEPADFLCSPCGHQCGCEGCLEQVLQTSAKCPICRVRFSSIQRVYRAGADATSAPSGCSTPVELPSILDTTHAHLDYALDTRSGEGVVAAPEIGEDEWPEEGAPLPEAPLASEMALSVELTDGVCAEGGPTTVVVNIKPPEGGEQRAKADVCCVIDISASMRTLATYEDETTGQQKSDGLNVLDLVKHAVKTVMHMLNDGDRLSLISFNDTAVCVLPLTPMTTAGRQKAIAALDSLQPNGRTNIWGGVLAGLESLRPHAEPGRTSSVLLLTDGQPNVKPPKGEVNELKNWTDEYPAFSFQLNTFGFGYNLDSELLLNLAVEGSGTFAFIPDAVIVGTTFVNSIANVLSTYTQEASLSLTACGGASFAGEVIGGHACVNESWGRAVALGPLQLGQLRSIAVPMHLPPTNPDSGQQPYLDVVVSYSSCCDPGSCGKPGRSEAVGINRETITTDALVGMMRGMAVSAGLEAVRAAMNGKGREAQTTMEGLVQTLESGAAASSEGEDIGRLTGLLADAKGRMSKALQGASRFNRWGVHYLRALLRAHQVHLCTNFMDTGLQYYGGEQFKTLRDEGDKIFLSLPAPKPSSSPSSSAASGSYRAGGGAARATAVVRAAAPSMSTYYAGAGGGCFGRGSSVLVATDGGFMKRDVFEVQPGDCIAVSNYNNATTGPATAQVVCVVKIAEPVGSTLCMLPSGLHITGSHPICIDGVWQLPKNHRDATRMANADRSVVNFVLSIDARCWNHGQSVLVSGIECAAWGHGLSDECVAHEFFGTSAVVKSIAQADPAGFKSGYVTLSGFVCDADGHFMLEPAPSADELELIPGCAL